SSIARFRSGCMTPALGAGVLGWSMVLLRRGARRARAYRAHRSPRATMSTMSSTPGGHAESAPQPQRPVESTPAELAAQQGVPARGSSHYARGTAANMIRSMVVILVIVFALYFISGRTNGTAQDTVDVVGTAQHHAQPSGHPYAYPKDLPEDWTPSSARYASSEVAMTWQAWCTTPDA